MNQRARSLQSSLNTDQGASGRYNGPAHTRTFNAPLKQKNMGRIADRLGELLKRMEESDRRLQRLTEQHIADTRKTLDELQRLNSDQ